MVHLPVWRFRGSKQGGGMVAQLHIAQHYAIYWTGDQDVNSQHDYNLDMLMERVRHQPMDFASTAEGSIPRLHHAFCNRIHETTISDDGRDGTVRVLLHRQ